MIDQEFIRQLSQRAAALYPAAQQARAKIEQDLYQLLQRSLTQMQIVSQDEFKAQLKVLEQANRKIDELEKKVEALEQQRPDETRG